MEVCVKEAIFKEFWNRYDEFVHLMNISLMMNDIKRYIDNIYNDLLDSKLIVEYFVSDFVYIIFYIFLQELIHQKNYPLYYTLLQEITEKMVSLIPESYRVNIGDKEMYNIFYILYYQKEKI